MTQGKIELDYKYPEHIETIISKLEDTGVDIKYNGGSVSIDATDFIPDSVDVSTSTFPGFPTDMQAQWIAYMSLADGSSTVTDNIYFDRFNHVPELSRLGAKIEVIKNSAVIKGVEKLRGAKVMSTDLRASASLLLGGLAAEGETEVLRIYHLDRGYERIEEKLQILGADILRVSTSEY